jgi:hypothetical protein
MKPGSGRESVRALLAGPEPHWHTLVLGMIDDLLFLQACCPGAKYFVEKTANVFLPDITTTLADFDGVVVY